MSALLAVLGAGAPSDYYPGDPEDAGNGDAWWVGLLLVLAVICPRPRGPCRAAVAVEALVGVK